MTIFEQLLQDGSELGFQFCVIRHGRELVHFAGGRMGLCGPEVTGESLFPVFSVTKGLAAMLVHQCIDRGWLKVDEPVAKWWLEFAVGGKESVTFREVLHHLAGIPNLPPGITAREVLDWEQMSRVVAALRPVHRGRFQYHAWTFGWPVRIVLERATGKPFQALLQELLVEPLGLDGALYIGCPAEVGACASKIVEPGLGEADRTRPFEEVLSMEIAGRPLGYFFNYPPVLGVANPAGSGVANARAIATCYAALLPGGGLVSEERWNAILRWEICTNLEGKHERCSLGFRWRQMEIGGRVYDAVGHSGYGGSIGLAIPGLGVAVGYTRNAFCAQPSLSQLLNAVLG